MVHTSFTAIRIDLTTVFASEESGWNQKAGLLVEKRLPKLLTQLNSHLFGLHGWLIYFIWLSTYVKGFPTLGYRKIGNSDIHGYVIGKRIVGSVLVYTDWECFFWFMNLYLGITNVNLLGKKRFYILFFKRYLSDHWCIFKSKLRLKLQNL